MIIRQLIIYTSNLKDQTGFYKDLELPLIEFSESSATFGIGNSILTFIQRKDNKPYHFAINIPCNKTEEALAWIKRKATVLKYHGNEIVDFSRWNALSFYFHDKDNNIIEFIARKNLRNENYLRFGGQSLLEISEVGVAVDDVQDTFNAFNLIRPLPLYDGNLERFCAAGDEHGLFIIIDKNNKRWMPTDEIAEQADFIMKGDFNIEFADGKIRERSAAI
jgi:catechol-2,3-dioxygenase